MRAHTCVSARMYVFVCVCARARVWLLQAMHVWRVGATEMLAVCLVSDQQRASDKQFDARLALAGGARAGL